MKYLIFAIVCLCAAASSECNDDPTEDPDYEAMLEPYTCIDDPTKVCPQKCPIMAWPLCGFNKFYGERTFKTNCHFDAQNKCCPEKFEYRRFGECEESSA